MKTTRRPHQTGPHPQPLAQGSAPVEPEYHREQGDLNAARAWLWHMEAGRIGGSAESSDHSHAR